VQQSLIVDPGDALASLPRPANSCGERNPDSGLDLLGYCAVRRQVRHDVRGTAGEVCIQHFEDVLAV